MSASPRGGDPPPSLPPFVRVVLAPATTGLLWFAFGVFGLSLALTAWLGWYVYEGYAGTARRRP